MCTICKKSIRRGGWSDHLSTKAHKRVVRKKKANQKKARETNAYNRTKKPKPPVRRRLGSKKTVIVL